MSSTTKTPILTRAAAAKQMAGLVPAALTAADSISGDRLQQLSLINQARVSRLTRTAASATAQYGAQSTQAVAAQAAVSAGQAAVARIQVLHQQARTAAPQVAATGWVLHGRVYDALLQPVSGHTVFLVDNQKTYQQSYGFAYTDSTGYFLINYPGAPATPPPTAPAPAAASTSPLFVQVASPAGRPVYLSGTAWLPNLGAAAYQNLTLPAGEPPLGDPPPAIRKVALPPQA